MLEKAILYRAKQVGFADRFRKAFKTIPKIFWDNHYIFLGKTNMLSCSFNFFVIYFSYWEGIPVLV